MMDFNIFKFFYYFVKIYKFSKIYWLILVYLRPRDFIWQMIIKQIIEYRAGLNVGWSIGILHKTNKLIYYRLNTW